MANYIILRYGSNSANQPMENEAVVGLVTAANRDKAIEEAVKWIDCYSNQHLSSILFSKAPKWMKELAVELSIIIRAVCPVCGKEAVVETWQAETGFLPCIEHE